MLFLLLILAISPFFFALAFALLIEAVLTNSDEDLRGGSANEGRPTDGNIIPSSLDFNVGGDMAKKLLLLLVLLVLLLLLLLALGLLSFNTSTTYLSISIQEFRSSSVLAKKMAGLEDTICNPKNPFTVLE